MLLLLLCYSNYTDECMRAKSFQLPPTLCNPMDLALQVPLFMGFSRQEYWSGLPCPSLDLPNPGIEPMSLISPVLSGRFFFFFLVRQILYHSATWEAPQK